ncbi:MAG: DUF4160 domain-containing protein [Gammaproteobacteria bacterium]
MPTAARAGPYRLFFYSGDRSEPEHVHVERDSLVAKFWLAPVELAWNRGFNQSELRRIHAIIATRQTALPEKWHGYFRE